MRSKDAARAECHIVIVVYNAYSKTESRTEAVEVFVEDNEGSIPGRRLCVC